MSVKRKVVVEPYSSSWPKLFMEEALFLREILGNNCISIHHIGSTAVPGLAAKPIIDIMPIVRDINKVTEIPHYVSCGEYGIAGRRYFYKKINQEIESNEGNNDYTDRSHHIHIFEIGHLAIRKHIAFRNLLRKNKIYREKYEALKRDLSEKFKYDIESYTSGKASFILELLNNS